MIELFRSQEKEEGLGIYNEKLKLTKKDIEKLEVPFYSIKSYLQVFIDRFCDRLYLMISYVMLFRT